MTAHSSITRTTDISSNPHPRSDFYPIDTNPAGERNGSNRVEYFLIAFGAILEHSNYRLLLDLYAHTSTKCEGCALKSLFSCKEKVTDMRARTPRPLNQLNWLVMAIVFACLWTLPQPVLAQCGDYPEDSSCKTCHDESYPVYGTGEWHDIHARKDCCWNCHGGNSRSMDKETAHAGMVLNPLTDTYQDCYACHPYDYDERATIFGAQLNIETGSTTPTPIEAAATVRLPDESREVVILPSSQPSELSELGWLPVVSLLGLGILILVGFSLASNNYHNDHTSDSSDA